MALSTVHRDLVKWALDSFNRSSNGSSMLSLYALWDEYYRGIQTLNINYERWYKTFGTNVTPPRENLCGVCVDTIADLLQIEGFASFNKSDTAIGELAQEIWRRNRMEERAGQVHKNTLIYRESFVVVWPDDEGEPVLYPNTPINVTVKYHPEKVGYITLGAKRWIEDGYTRLTLYTNDEIIRLRTKTKSSTATILNTTATAGSFDFYDDGEVPPQAKNIYGKVPIFRFVNNAAIGGEGISEIESIQAPQDTLDGALANKEVTREYIAYPQKYAIGYQIRSDADGNPINPFISGPNNVWVNESPDGTFGQLAQGNLEDHIKEAADARMQIARISGIPPHYFGMDAGGWPSGESLKTASTRLTSKVLDRMTSYGNSWGDAMRFALEIKGIANVGLETLWTDPTPRLSELESWQAALAEQQAGGNRTRTLKNRGYSEQEIKEAEEKRQEALFGEGVPRSADAGDDEAAQAA